MTWSEASDSDLIQAIRRDSGAIEELYLRHRSRIIRYAARRCEQPADVADVVALTFLAVLQHSDSYDPSRGAVVPWLIGIAHNQMVGFVRREQRQRTITERVVQVRTLTNNDLIRLEEQIDASRDSVVLERALAKLSVPQREAFWLVAHDGLTPAEAAAALQIPPGVFRLRLSRARRALRRELGDRLENQPIPVIALAKEVDQ